MDALLTKTKPAIESSKDSNQPKQKISGSQVLLNSLVEEGVDKIFGYPGGAIMPVYDALYHYTDKLNHILVRHEQGAIHAAQGYARVTGRAGVVFATSGPGATNLVTGLADALIDSTPVVCITGQVFAHLLGTDAFQECDVVNTTIPVTKWNIQVTEAKDIADAVAKAFYIASSGRPGPVLVDITKNAQNEMIEEAEYHRCEGIRTYRPKPVMQQSQVDAAAELDQPSQTAIHSCGPGHIVIGRNGGVEGVLRKNRNPSSMYVAWTWKFPHGPSELRGISWNARQLRAQPKHE